MYRYLMEGNKEDREQLFSVVPTDRTSNNVHSLKPRKFCLNTSEGKKNLSVKSGQMLEQVTQRLSLEILRT